MVDPDVILAHVASYGETPNVCPRCQTAELRFWVTVDGDGIDRLLHLDDLPDYEHVMVTSLRGA